VWETMLLMPDPIYSALGNEFICPEDGASSPRFFIVFIDSRFMSRQGPEPTAPFFRLYLGCHSYRTPYAG
jgi:hypothetical protein